MSWIEVETKIRIKDPKEARRKIGKIAKFIGTEKKVDDYYSLEKKHYPKKSLRVRDKGKKREVNFKQWLSYRKGIHAKKEVEFEVSDLKGFFDLLDNFGFEKWLRKEKRTELYRTKEGVNIELNYVKKLGWFIEIEVICKKSELKKAERKITLVRKKLEIPSDRTEKRGYTRELWNLRERS